MDERAAGTGQESEPCPPCAASGQCRVCSIPGPRRCEAPGDGGGARALPGSAEISGCGRDSWAPAGAVWQLIFLVFLPGALCCPSNCGAASAPPPRVGRAAGASPLPCVGTVRYFWGSLGALPSSPAFIPALPTSKPCAEPRPWGCGAARGREQPPPLGPELLPPSPVLQTRFPLPQLRKERLLFACLLGQRVWEGVRAL